MSLGAAGLKFCAAASARANILKPVADGGHGWIITSDGRLCTKHKVTFDSQSGSAVAGKMVSYTDKIIAPNTPSRQGYTFVGWYTDTAFTTAWDFANDTMPDNDLTLYAKWTKNPASASTLSPELPKSPGVRLAETGSNTVLFVLAASIFVASGIVLFKKQAKRP